MTELEPAMLARLATLDTPTVCNALEIVAPQRRGYGFTVEPLVCIRPELGSMVGYARTATITAREPAEGTAADRSGREAYYRYVEEGPRPSIMVIEDLDDPARGYGSWWGEVNSNIHAGLGCVGVVTSGSIRDVADIAVGFQMLADRVGPSHAFVRPVATGIPVTVAGMDVHPGDLVHGDRHGAVVIPHDVAADLVEAASLVSRRERVVIEASQRSDFDLERLMAAWGDADEIH